jgi:thiol:disulfide interchange protein DsbD
VCVTVVLLTTVSPATGTPIDDPFSSANQAAAKKQDRDDPFAPANEVRPQQVSDVVENRNQEKAVARKLNDTPIDERIDYDVAVSPSRVRRGETVKLTIIGAPRPGYHTYPLTQRSSDPAQDPSQLSSLRYSGIPGVQPLWPVTESDPEFKTEVGVGVLLEHELPFTWTQDLLILPDAAPGLKTLSFIVKQQVCNGNCVWGEPQFEVKIEVSGDPAVPLSAALQERKNAMQPPIRVVTAPGAKPGAETTPGPGTGSQSSPANEEKRPSADLAATAPKQMDTGLLAFLLQGVLWGAISLVTPCVFPMIPITVSFFLKHSDLGHAQALKMAVVYSLTIVTVLTAGAVLLLNAFQSLSQHWSTNLVLGGLFLFFTLSLFGMYEIRLPSGLANFTSTREGQGGLLGTVFMALTFTIISFTCVAPFLGGFAGINVQSRPWWEIVLGGLAFSVTFATPFLLLALFPTLLRQMPKSGSWMNAVKVVMGFLELAAALKFLRTAELLYFRKGQFLTYDFVLGIYVALALLCGLYLLNLYRLPHDHEPAEQIGVPRLLFSLVFLALGFYLMPGLFKDEGGESQRPKGSVFAWVDAFLLKDPPEGLGEVSPMLRGKVGPENGKGGKQLSWIGNLETGLQLADAQKKLVFIDFTGLG